jgi:Ca2+-binding EF-hand superfamily protein
MARPDPEVDIAFLLMDRNKRGHIGLEDFKAFTLNKENNGDLAENAFKFDIATGNDSQ